jgi:hypothetical protein
MATTIRAVFDGEVLHLEDADGLRPGVTYLVTVQAEAPGETTAETTAARIAEAEPDSEEPYVLTTLREMALDMGVDDLASNHDWYAHGRLPDDAR